MNKLIKLGLVASLAGATGFSLYKGYKWLQKKKQEADGVEVTEDDLIVLEALAQGLEHDIKEHDDPFEMDEEEQLDEIDDELPPSFSVTARNNEEIQADPDIEFDPHYLDKSPEEEAHDNEDVTDREDDAELKYPASTPEAYEQYKQMILANISKDNPAYPILEEMFELPWDPNLLGVMGVQDANIQDDLLDWRRHFFLENVEWTKFVTYAELIIYFVKRADFDLGLGYDHWADQFVSNLGLTVRSGSTDIERVATAVGSHQFVNHKTQLFGLFGVTSSMLDTFIARKTAKNPNESVEFLDEYAIFSKDYVDKMVENDE